MGHDDTQRCCVAHKLKLLISMKIIAGFISFDNSGIFFFKKATISRPSPESVKVTGRLSVDGSLNTGFAWRGKVFEFMARACRSMTVLCVKETSSFSSRSRNCR
jgi:hypothetical protein